MLKLFGLLEVLSDSGVGMCGIPAGKEILPLTDVERLRRFVIYRSRSFTALEAWKRDRRRTSEIAGDVWRP